MRKTITLLLFVSGFLGNAIAQQMPFDGMNKNHPALTTTHEGVAPVIAKKNENQNSFFSSVILLDSAVHWTWDTLSASWTLHDMTIYSYDGMNRVTNELYKTWDGTEWDPAEQFQFTYDVNNDTTSWLDQYWNGAAWVNYIQYLYTYDMNNNQTLAFGQTWDGAAWANYFQYLYTYDGNNNRDTALTQTWDGLAWVNYFQYIYTYDLNNNQTIALEQNWDGSSWGNYTQHLFAYDANDNSTNDVLQIWIGSWLILSQNVYVYDANNNEISGLLQSWNGTMWLTTERDTNTYDSNNNQLSNLHQLWNTTSWLNQDSTHYYYHIATGIQEANKQGALTMYPNPTHDIINITLSDMKSGEVNVFNVLGEKVYSEMFAPQPSGYLQLNVNVPAGIYFVKLNSADREWTGRIIIE